MTDSDVTFTFGSIPFDEEYRPADDTRITTNFANLARGEQRRDNLRATLMMIDRRFNALMDWDNPTGDRYGVSLDILSIGLDLGAGEPAFPLIEMLETHVIDRRSGTRLPGIVGNNFSSYLRDYDFSVVLPEYRQQTGQGEPPPQFGDLHGKLFRHLLRSYGYRARCGKPPVICLSVSSQAVYHRTANLHPILGIEYQTEAASLTDAYFAKMGMTARYFLPPHGAAPLAFYHIGDLVSDYSNGELASTISTMESFQKIYRPEIYNANAVAAAAYRPSLSSQDYSLTRIVYDREERSRLAVDQGRYAQQHLIEPHGATLARWSATCGL
ncbi:putative oxygenase MesX [Sphingomonas sp. CV7422]|uniref:putative oxygenase MesX n=1 Tax=Sphingomonas sp. CV7422 TaxID=3018036 RepID=UPI0022FDC6A4|nr:putative oxygenase MesX [Sphingomonas sp. CV7422]